MLISAQLIDELKQNGILRKYRDGETVFLHNEPATGMYVILQGNAQVVRRNPQAGTTDVLATVRAGETMGEVSLLLGTPHTATVVARGELETILLTRTRLSELKRENSALALRLYEMLAMTLARHLYERPW
ncbi:MAG: cyclic nucleotide-binding domain-containing protein [Anaerolineales bacterium]